MGTHKMHLMPRLQAWLVRIAAVCTLGVLAACGGGGTGSGEGNTSQAGETTGVSGECSVTFTDSFNRPVSCETMRQLSGWEFASGDAASEGGGDASGDAGSESAGGDGVAADGRPIPDIEIEFEDARGRIILTRTNDEGYFRVNLGGLQAPIVATVRRDGNAWRSALVDTIEKGRAQFYTVNLTGLTDLVLQEFARSAGVDGGSDAVDSSILTSNFANWRTSIEAVNARLAPQLQAQGIDPFDFNPFTVAFEADASNPVDRVLEAVKIEKTDAGETVVGVRDGIWNFKVGLTYREQGMEDDIQLIPPNTPLGAIEGADIPRKSDLTQYIQSAPPQELLVELLAQLSDGNPPVVNGDGSISFDDGSEEGLVFRTLDIRVEDFVDCGSCDRVGDKVEFKVRYSVEVSGFDGGISKLDFTASVLLYRTDYMTVEQAEDALFDI